MKAHNVLMLTMQIIASWGYPLSLEKEMATVSYNRNDISHSSKSSLFDRQRATVGAKAWNAVKCVACAIVVPLVVLAIVLLAFPTSPRMGHSRLRGATLFSDLAVRPIHYDLQITPNFHRQYFTGEVNLMVECLRDTSLITMHSRNLLIKKAVLRDDSGNNIDVAFFTNEDTGRLELRSTTGRLLHESRYNITIDFSGIMNKEGDDISLLIDSYSDADNPSEIVRAWTFAKLRSARRLFPCFDSPSHRATFEVRVLRPKSFVAISSAHESSCKGVGDRVLCTFQRTVRISPDQLALVVTNLSSVTQGRVTLWSPALPALADLADRIVAVAEKEMGVKLPCEKLRVIAVTTLDKPASTKWCVVIVEARERVCSLTAEFTKKKSSCVVPLVGHVISMWFGVVVAFPDDSDRWLCVTLSVYYSFKVLGILFPTWGIDELIALRVLTSKSSYREPKPIKFVLQALPEHVNAIVWKSVGILRMFESVITSAVFTNGTTRFLKSFQYKAASSSDVLRTLDSSCALFRNLSTWLSDPVYPLVTMRRTNATYLALLQETFRDLSRFSYPSRNALPMTVTARRGGTQEPSFVSWMTNISQTLQIPPTSSKDWILVNSDGIGYFRVLYTPLDMSLITNQLNEDPSAFTPIQRAVLVDDLFYAALSGRITSNYFAEAIKHLPSEEAWLPLMTYLELAANIPYQWLGAWKAGGVLDWRVFNVNFCSRALVGNMKAQRESAKVLLRESLLAHCCAFL
ncbi:glutamyl aminopeptidase [Rhipicephalus microplus]|uniref:glutamyl aminopeptidase n=1 Tax=Rhipicephalus microplus TaxID=6941 RepID=UPI003F6B181C